MSAVANILQKVGIFTAGAVNERLSQTERKMNARLNQVRNDMYVRGAHDQAKRMSRSYDAGQLDRLSSDWNPPDYSADQHWYTAFPRLRSRARDLVMNDGYAERFMRLSRLNIVGPDGFKFQVDVRNDDGTTDTLANTKIEEKFRDWVRRENCTITGRMSFRKVQQIVTESLKRDGEFIVVKLYNESKYGFQLQVMEPDLLDERRNPRLPNGNVICLGVEMDLFRRPVAYWLRPSERLRDLLTSGWAIGESKRIPAEFVYHGFDTRRAFSTRGASHMAPSMRRMRTIHAFEEAYAGKAVATASWGGVWEQIDKDAPDPNLSDGKTERGEPTQELEPQMIIQAPWGHKFTPFDPKFPDAGYDSFMQTSLRGVASGWGVGFNIFANNLTGVSYSSIRAGVLDEREYWKDDQSLLTEELLEPVYADWLRVQLLSQMVALPLSKFQKFNCPVFTGRRWAWVDPMKDIEAAILEIQMGGSTLTQFLAEKGEDITDILRERSEEQALAKKYKVELSIDQIKATSKSAAGAAVEEDAAASTSANENRVVDEWMELIERFKRGDFTNDDDERAMALLNGLIQRSRNGHGKKEAHT